MPVDIHEGHSKNKYPWNSRGSVCVIPVKLVLTDIIGLIRFDSEFMRNEKFGKTIDYENRRGSG